MTAKARAVGLSGELLGGNMNMNLVLYGLESDSGARVRCSARSKQTCAFRGGSVVMKMIKRYTKMLGQHHAPEMAKVEPLLEASWIQFKVRRVATVSKLL
jgi:hypothetical protein